MFERILVQPMSLFKDEHGLCPMPHIAIKVNMLIDRLRSSERVLGQNDPMSRL